MDPTDPVDENAIPVAFGGNADAIEDAVLRGDLPAAEDPDGDPLVYAKAGDPANGRVTVAPNGSFVYTPDPDFFGLDAFDFSVSDGRGGVAVQTMSILVEAVDDAPVLVTATPDQLAYAGQAFLLALPQGAFYDVDSPFLDYSAERSDGTPLPEWLFFDPLTRSFDGTPAATDAGRIDVRVTASDGNASVADVFALTVKVLPTIAISPASLSLNEGNAGAARFTFTLTRSGDLAAASDVRWSVGSTQASPQDFAGGVWPGGTVSFAARQSSAQVIVDAVGDRLLEANEVFTVTLSGPAGAVLGNAIATGVILNDEPLPYPTISGIPDLSAAAMASAAPLVFSAHAEPATGFEVAAVFSSAASSPGYRTVFAFQALAGAAYRITAASHQDPASLTIHDRFGNALALGDDLDDPTVTLGGIAYETDRIDGWIAPYSGTFHVFADFRPGAYFDRCELRVEGDFAGVADLPAFSVAASADRIDEGQGGTTVAPFIVTRTGSGAGSHVVDWRVDPLDANAADFAGGVLPSGRITLGDGELSARIDVPLAADLVLEPDEAFTLRISLPSGAPVTVATASAVIANDDSLPVLSLFAVDAARDEGDTGATLFTFNVRRDGDPTVQLSVGWRVSSEGLDGAVADAADFAGAVLPSGSLELAAGQVAATLVVRVNGDPVLEGDERFAVVLTDPVGGTLGTARAEATIVDDDLPVCVLVTGTAGNDPALTGGAGNDTVSGLAGNDTLTGLGGDDLLDGGAGVDTAFFTGALSGYTLSRTGGTLTIADLTTGRDGTDTATNLERLKFADMGVNLTVQAAAASIDPAALDRICELYVGFFGRVPAADGLENWINQFKGGKTLDAIADDFYGIGSSVDLRQVTGYWDFANNRELSNADFVRIAYRNVLGRDGLDAGINYWAGQLSGPEAKTRGELVSTMLDAAHGLKVSAEWGWVANLLDDRIAISKSVAVDWGLNYAATAQQAIGKGMEIAGAVKTSANPNPLYKDIPVKVFDFEAAVELVGVNPAGIDLIG